MSGDILIRDYVSPDYPGLLKVWEECGMGGAQRGDDALVIANTLRIGGKLWVMEMDGEIIGSSWVTNDGRRLYLHHFGIRPDWQHKGLSHLLLKPALEMAAARKMQIKLEVHRTNVPAVHLYKKHGFAYLGDYEVYIIRNPECVSLTQI